MGRGGLRGREVAATTTPPAPCTPAAFLAMAFDRLGETQTAHIWLEEAQRRFVRVAGPDAEPHPHLEEAVRAVTPR